MNLLREYIRELLKEKNEVDIMELEDAVETS